MPNNSVAAVLHELNRIVAPAGTDELGDAELLQRFARRRDQAAFELLVWRHGPMVFGLCQRLLRHEQDAEDALQATFLVLVRKASSISKKESLASWLYKVAYRIACRARARTPALSNQSAILEAKGAPDEADAVWRDLREKLDREVAQLPENYRRPIVLCYLEGKTHEEAARLLGCPKGTLASNLARARDRLHRRLTRRGWALSSAVLGTVLAEKAVAGVLAPELVQQTVRSALAYSAGQTAGVSANTIVLTEGVLRLMWYGKLKMAAGLFLAFVLCAAGVGLVIRQAWAGNGAENGLAAPPVARQHANGPQAGNEGDAQKEIAVLRAEIADLRKELAAALKEIKILKDFLRQAAVPPPEKEPLYRAKPASFWLEQFKDA
ncbi:MAG: sigma-70 family RNA polymerase sigma factor, partial [Gemmataceae bacterium]|nr:sigma-70 family RNA polymerase sigma factor [Gemmataceae bacterium]